MIERLKAKDKAAWDEAIKNHSQRVRNLIWPLVPREDIEDVYQEVWTSAYAGIEGFRGECEFTTWLHSLTVNTATAWFNKSIRGGNKISLDDLHLEQHAHTPKDSNFENLLKGLSLEDKQLFRLHYEHGYTQTEIADMLGYNSRKAVNARMVRARKTIKENLGSAGCPDSGGDSDAASDMGGEVPG